MQISSRAIRSLRPIFELLSSMRFAVSLLVIIAVAAINGTVLKQNEPYPSYVFEFGQFWFEVFNIFGLYDVYHSLWFLALLAFLVLSTGLCIVRKTPVILREIRNYREAATERTLAAFKHTVSFDIANYSLAPLTVYLKGQGFRFKVNEREDGSLLLAAKKGTANQLGYFFTHIAIIVIALGGLVDGNLPLTLAELRGKLTPETRNIPQVDVPAKSRLASDNLSFRGNVTIAEQHSADVVFINAGQGYLVQELPFILTLKKFHVDYYSNGMPKLFASDILITDKASGQQRAARVQVNHPVIVNGVAIYQASFGDGGSALKLKAWNLARPALSPVPIDAKTLASQPLKINGEDYQLELGELRVFNIQELMRPDLDHPQSLVQRLQDVRHVKKEKKLQNIGPSITFKLRDKHGQAREFHHYMSPVSQDGANYLVIGVREAIEQPFHYLRIPLDADFSINTFMRLRAALMSPEHYGEIAHMSARKAIENQAITPQLRVPFEQSIKWILARFAQGGFAGLETFLDKRVPADKHQAIAQTYLKILQGAIIEVMEVANEKAGLPPLAYNAANYRFLIDSLIAMSAFHDYGAPVFLQLSGFEHVQASGFQITRAPGKVLVYLGACLLVLGIIFMCCLRQTRLWVLFSGHRVRISMSFNRAPHDIGNSFRFYVNGIADRLKGK